MTKELSLDHRPNFDLIFLRGKVTQTPTFVRTFDPLLKVRRAASFIFVSKFFIKQEAMESSAFPDNVVMHANFLSNGTQWQYL